MNKMGRKSLSKLVTPFFALTGVLVILLSAGTFWKDGLISIQDELRFRKRVSFLSPVHYSIQSVSVGEGFKPFDFSYCDNIFLDVGSNVGVQIRKLFEPEKYRSAPFIEVFDKLFPGHKASNKRSCGIGFEANPNHAQRHRDIESAYSRKGWKMHIYSPVAVSNEDDFLDFYIDPISTKVGERVNSEVEKIRRFGAASSVIPKVYRKKGKVMGVQTANIFADDEKVTAKSFGEKRLNSVLVKAVDLSRVLKPICHAKLSRNITIIMKMDIEQSEYIVLPKLLMDGTLCCIDNLFIEWHSWQLKKEEYLKEFERVFSRMLADNKNATRLHDLDDESFAYDGMPLP